MGMLHKWGNREKSIKFAGCAVRFGVPDNENSRMPHWFLNFRTFHRPEGKREVTLENEEEEHTGS